MNRSIGRRSFLKTSLALGERPSSAHPIGMTQGVRACQARHRNEFRPLGRRSTGNVLVFRGIPFAKSPVGPLRFRPPEPPDPWTGIRAATSFGPGGPQGVNPVAAVLPSSFQRRARTASTSTFSPPTRPVSGRCWSGSTAVGISPVLARNCSTTEASSSARRCGRRHAQLPSGHLRLPARPVRRR